MTIDEAIKYADMLSCNVNAFEVSKQFGAMCADALRQMKKMNENAGISATPVQDTWQERMKREYHETKEHYEKLHRAVTKYEAGMLNCSIDLLKRMKRHMGEYLHDLEIRAEIEGVNLYD